MSSADEPQRDEAPPDGASPPDPLFVSSLRELRWIVIVWAISFAWVIGYCIVAGYDSAAYDGLEHGLEHGLEASGGQIGARDVELRLVLGMPSWVFWGVMLPWILVTLLTAWFALTQMADHPLENPLAQESVDG